jgi:hypothetical protein
MVYIWHIYIPYLFCFKIAELTVISVVRALCYKPKVTGSSPMRWIFQYPFSPEVFSAS